MDAYLRRKNWEFRAQAAAIVNVLNESMGGTASGDAGKYNNGFREISTDAMFQRLGFE